jgi:hypothetical protein
MAWESVSCIRFSDYRHGLLSARDGQNTHLVWRLATVFFDIAVHRRGPEHLPASQFLLVLLFVSYLIVGFIAIRMGGAASSSAFLLFVADSLIYLVYLLLVLNFFKRPRRFLQTATALVGADILFNLLGIPLLVWSVAADTAGSDATVPTFLFIVLFFWSVDVAGYVVSRALERPYIVGVLIVIMYVMTSLSVRESFAPVTP